MSRAHDPEEMSVSGAELNGFHADPRRDASAAIAGFYFQMVTTVLRWVELAPGHVLFCESGEDIDEVFRDIESATWKRILDQLKLRKGISLRSPDALTAMARFLEHRRRNSPAGLHYRFSTTARPQVERDCAFPRGLSGIQAWTTARQADLTAEETDQFIEGLRRVVASSKQPPDLTAALFDDFKTWAATAPRGDILEFVERFEWAMDDPGSAARERQIASALQERGLASTDKEARTVADLLIAHVLRLLTQRGEKRLTAEDLAGTLADRASLEVDRALLQTFRSRIDEIQASLQTIEEVTSRTDSRTAEILKILQGVLPGVLRDITAGSLPLEDTPPDLPALFVPRVALERQLIEAPVGDWIWLIGSSGMGKTTLAASALRGRGYSWITLSPSDAGPLPDEYLRMQLLRISQAGGENPTLPERYWRGRLSLRELASAAVASLPAEKALVIDNVPELLPGSRLLSHLEEIGRQIRSNNRRLFTTSQYTPPRVLMNLGLRELEIPPLSQEEIRDLLAAAGAPAAYRNPKFVALVLALTKGHPTLCQAAVAFLRMSSWRLDDEAFGALFSGAPWRDAQDEGLHQFQRMALPAARELIYRLSLVDRPFDIALAWDLAAIPPSLGNAQELLQGLLGPWVVRLQGDLYGVCALLARSGQRMLTPAVQEATHRAIARFLLKAKTIDQFEAASIALHFVQAKDWTGLSVFLLKSAFEVSDRHVAEALEFLTRLEPGRDWPADLPAHEVGSLLAAQVRILAALGKDFTTVLDRLDVVAATGSDVQMFVPLMLAGPLNPGLRPGPRAQRSLSFARMFMRLPEDLRRLPSALDIEGLLWLGVTAANDLGDIRDLLAVLREMTPAERERALHGELFWVGGAGLLDAAWRLELRKAPEDRDWSAILELLSEAQAAAALDGGARLLPLVVRARAIVLGELRRYEEGLSQVEAAIPAADPEERFLLLYTAACLHVDRKDDENAIASLTVALKDPPRNLAIYVSLARLLGIAPLARAGQLLEAQALIRDYLLDGEEALPERIRWELFGEYAWLLWLQGKRRRTIAALAAVLLGLDQVEAPDARRELLVKAGHVLSQITLALQRESKGEPASELDVFPGLFLTSNSVLLTLPGSRPPHAVLLLAGRLAVEAGALSLARHVLEEAEQLGALEAGNPEQTPILALIEHELARLETRQGHFSAALRHALHFARFAPEIQRLRALEEAAVAGENPPGEKVLPEEVAIGYAVAPAIASALASGGAAASVRAAVDQLEEVLAAEPGLSESPSSWKSFFADLREAYSPLATVDSLEGQLKTLGKGQPTLRALIALAVGLCPEASPGRVAGYQAAAFDQFLTLVSYDSGLLPHASRFVARYWAEHTIVPDPMRRRLREEELPPQSVAALLLSLVGALKVGVPAEILARLETFAKSATM